jgi:arylsulfatase A-like enzyme
MSRYITKSRFLVPAILILVLLLTGCETGKKEKRELKGSRPNIVFILTDDQGYGDLSCHGNPVLKTPNMDWVHDHAVCFTDFMVSPTCAPTRAALYSGMHEFKTGVYDTRAPRNHMSLQVLTLAEVLKASGYVTGLFGKWHLGLDSIRRPEHRGFDVALTSLRDMDYKIWYDPPLARNGVPEHHKGYRTDILFEEALKFIEQNKDTTFFCHIPTFSPHAPLEVPEKYSSKWNGNKFFGMISCVDDHVGELLRRLRELGIADKTLVILMSDNGATFGADIWNAHMRGVKTTAWYGGTRTFSFWYWPGVLQPAAVDAQTAHVDVLPTLADLAGFKIPPQVREQLDGRSLVPLLKDPHAPWPDRMLFTHVGRWKEGAIDEHKYCQCNVRWGDYVAVRIEFCDDPHCWAECPIFRRVQNGEPGYYSKKYASFNYAVTPKGEWALYDIKKDISQNDNIAEKHPEIVQKLSEQYEFWWKKIYPCVCAPEQCDKN